MNGGIESNWVKILVDMVAILPDDDPRSLVFLGQYLEFTPLPSLESCVKVHNKLLKLISSSMLFPAEERRVENNVS